MTNNQNAPLHENLHEIKFHTDVDGKKLNFVQVETITHNANVIAIAEASFKNDPENKKHFFFNILDLTRKAEAGTVENQDHSLWDERKYWSGFKQLEFPSEIRLAGMSLVTFPTPDTHTASSIEGWEVHSDNKYVYFFYAINNELFSCRYTVFTQTLDSRDLTDNHQEEKETIQVVASMDLKREARFQQSGLREIPADHADKASIKDMNGKRFIEPSISFHKLMSPMVNNWFGICQSPAHIADHIRWNFFIPSALDANKGANGEIKYYSLLAHEDKGLDRIEVDEKSTYRLHSQKLRLDTKSENGNENEKYIAAPSCTSYRPLETAYDFNEKRVGYKPTQTKIALSWPTTNHQVLIDFEIDPQREGLLKLPKQEQVNITVPVISKFKTALGFNYNDDFDTLVTTASQKMSMQFWFRVDKIVGSRELIGNLNDRTLEGFSVRINDKGSISCIMGVQNGGQPSALKAIVHHNDFQQLTPGFWYNVAIVFSFDLADKSTVGNKHIQMYINGKSYDKQMYIMAPREGDKPGKRYVLSKTRASKIAAANYAFAPSNNTIKIGSNPYGENGKNRGFKGAMAQLKFSDSYLASSLAIEDKVFDDVSSDPKFDHRYTFKREDQIIGKLNGPDWVNDGPPISVGASISSNPISFSDGIGAIKSPENSEYEMVFVSKVQNSKDGMLKIYSPRKDYKNTLFNTKVSRALYELKWKSTDTHEKIVRGAILIYSKAVGIRGNHLRIYLLKQDGKFEIFLEIGDKIIKKEVHENIDQKTMIDTLNNHFGEYLIAFPTIQKGLGSTASFFYFNGNTNYAKLVIPGNYHGFENPLPTVFGDFSEAAAHGSLDFPENQKLYETSRNTANMLTTEGGFTFETFINNGNPNMPASGSLIQPIMEVVNRENHHLSQLEILAIIPENDPVIKNYITSKFGESKLRTKEAFDFVDWQHLDISYSKSGAYKFCKDRYLIKKNPELPSNNSFCLDTIITFDEAPRSGEVIFLLDDGNSDEQWNTFIKLYINDAGALQFGAHLPEISYEDGSRVRVQPSLNYFHQVDIDSNEKLKTNIPYYITASIEISPNNENDVFLSLIILDLQNASLIFNTSADKNPNNYQKEAKSSIVQLLDSTQLYDLTIGGKQGDKSSFISAKLDVLRIWNDPIHGKAATAIALSPYQRTRTLPEEGNISGTVGKSEIAEPFSCWEFNEEHHLKVKDLTGDNDLSFSILTPEPKFEWIGSEGAFQFDGEHYFSNNFMRRIDLSYAADNQVNFPFAVEAKIKLHSYAEAILQFNDDFTETSYTLLVSSSGNLALKAIFPTYKKNDGSEISTTHKTVTVHGAQKLALNTDYHLFIGINFRTTKANQPTPYEIMTCCQVNKINGSESTKIEDNSWRTKYVDDKGFLPTSIPFSNPALIIGHAMAHRINPSNEAKSHWYTGIKTFTGSIKLIKIHRDNFNLNEPPNLLHSEMPYDQRRVERLADGQEADTARSATENSPDGPSVRFAYQFRMNTNNEKILNDIWSRSEYDLYLKTDIQRGWVPSLLSAQVTLHINSTKMELKRVQIAQEDLKHVAINSELVLGGSIDRSRHFMGTIDEVKLWNEVKTLDELEPYRYRQISHPEKTLQAYWPISNNSGRDIDDRSGNMHFLKLDTATPATFWKTSASAGYLGSPVGLDNAFNQLLIGFDIAQISTVEYSEIYRDDEGIVKGTLERCYARISNETCSLYTNFIVGKLTSEFVQNVETKPQLIGYIEGAPPVPEENMTHPHYESASRYQFYMSNSSVRFSEAEKTSHSVASSKTTGFDQALSLYLAHNYVNKMDTALKTPILEFIFNMYRIEINHGWQFNSNRSSELNQGASFSEGSSKGKQYEQAIAGNWRKDPLWTTQPNPEELIEMSRRYKMDNKGYALVKSRVVNLYALRIYDTNEVFSYNLLPDPNIPENVNIIMFDMNPNYTKQGTLDGNLGLQKMKTDDAPFTPFSEKYKSYFKPLEAYSLLKRIEKEEEAIKTDYDHFDAGRGRNRSDLVNDPAKSAQEWAEKRRTNEEIQNLVSKRNIVNKYVWHADGGLYKEQEQVMLTRSESFGGHYNLSINSGYKFSGLFENKIHGAVIDASVLFGGHINSMVTKHHESSKGFELDVRLGVEDFLHGYLPHGGDMANMDSKKSWTEAPLPGKVSRYQFMSFYLAPSEENFQHFVNTVVKRDSDSPLRWLSSIENLKNPVWRIMHRVTHVDRLEKDQQPGNNTPNEVDNKGIEVTDIVKEDTPIVIHSEENRLLYSKLHDSTEQTDVQLLGKIYGLIFGASSSSGEAKPLGDVWEAYKKQLEAASGFEEDIDSTIKDQEKLKELEANIFNYFKNLGTLQNEEPAPTNG